MRQIIVLAVFIAVVAGAAVPSKNWETRQDYYYSSTEAQILRYYVDNIGLGHYKYAYELTDGTKQEQEGIIKNKGREDEALKVKGLLEARPHSFEFYKTTMKGSFSLGLSGPAFLSAIGG